MSSEAWCGMCEDCAPAVRTGFVIPEGVRPALRCASARRRLILQRHDLVAHAIDLDREDLPQERCKIHVEAGDPSEDDRGHPELARHRRLERNGLPDVLE